MVYIKFQIWIFVKKSSLDIVLNIYFWIINDRFFIWEWMIPLRGQRVYLEPETGVWLWWVYEDPSQCLLLLHCPPSPSILNLQTWFKWVFTKFPNLNSKFHIMLWPDRGYVSWEWLWTRSVRYTCGHIELQLISIRH